MVAVVTVSIAAAPNPGKAVEDSTVEAARLLREVNEFYGQLSAVQVSSKATVEADALPMTLEQKVEFRFQRPNLLAAHTTEGMSPSDIVCDGRELYLAAPLMGRYVIEPAPASLAELGAEAEAIAPWLAVFRDLVTSTAFTDTGAAFTIVGVEEVGGVPCRHLRRDAGIQLVDVWFEQGDRPWLRRCIRTRRANAPTAQADGTVAEPPVKARMLQEFGEWSTEAPPPQAFAIQPPEGLKKSASIFPSAEEMQALARGAASDSGQPNGESTAHPSVGTEAIPFRLDLVGGGSLDLSKHLGKDVVVLDFFATWCRPCIVAMPVVERVAKRYERQGVVLYAIDLAEASEKVDSFMREHGLTLRVALDRSGAVAAQYGAAGVPYTVLIGRDGRIAQVHVGYRADLEQRLDADLKQLVAPAAPGAGGGSR